MTSRQDSIGVVVATYGDVEPWSHLAMQAIISAETQTVSPDVVVYMHSDTLAIARNKGARAAGTDLLIFLDADDLLDPGYVGAMLMAADGRPQHLILRPSTVGMYEDGTEDQPVMIPRTDLRQRNCAVIGSCVRRTSFEQVGGFPEYPVLEDWALWRSIVKIGGDLIDVPEAIYKVSVRQGSRNSNTQLHNDTYRRILKEIPL